VSGSEFDGRLIDPRRRSTSECDPALRIRDRKIRRVDSPARVVVRIGRIRIVRREADSPRPSEVVTRSVDWPARAVDDRECSEMDGRDSRFVGRWMTYERARAAVTGDDYHRGRRARARAVHRNHVAAGLQRKLA